MGVADLGSYVQAIDTESDQVRRAKARDAGVWSAWHDEYYSFIYRYALARLVRHEDAEDVASQVFLEAIKGIDRYEYRGRPVLAWFYGIAQHLVSRRFREAKRQRPLDEVEATAGAAGEEDALLQRLALRAALESLKPEHQEVIRLRFLLDLSTAEAARLLGKTEAAVHSLQVRALGALRRQLRPPDAPEFSRPARTISPSSGHK
ncbi:MAG TPA: sigma-70 family RNA polymerase sigma factor [Dehalococcoidia bacterium]